jgi:hypothetical protein
VTQASTIAANVSCLGAGRGDAYPLVGGLEANGGFQVAGPQMIQGAAFGPIALAEEQFEHLELEPGECDRAIAAAHLTRPGVEGEIAMAQDARVGPAQRVPSRPGHRGGAAIVSLAFVAATRSAPPAARFVLMVSLLP